ncbi:hypothetical protein [Aporhodopirellula aestuarii]|uniref:HPt domain-containing protein n=1 Tax=Aporhodopirellula aestuarii TaxID=2950107 RepID=A0ABT0TZD5_9BACT|nr:hypothetical protein [Aporhodopirellula aestuarii]MCM2369974.1 hypothetical protein [Aporhodopirellula aestuarii]
MKTSLLTTYLNDHLAGSVMAIELLKRLESEHQGDEFASFAADLRREIEDEQSILRSLLDDLDDRGDMTKRLTAWLGSKLTIFKLAHQSAGKFGTFQSLETLSLGITGKRGLWRILEQLQPRETKLRSLDLRQLIKQADRQFSVVEERRMKLGTEAITENATQE